MGSPVDDSPPLAHHVQSVPAMEALGLAVAWVEPGLASAQMPVPPDAAADRPNPPASLATLVADTVSGNALVSGGHPRPAVTISLHVDCLAPMPASGMLHGRARLQPSGHSGPHFVTGTVSDDAGHVLASSASWWLPGRGDVPGTPPEERDPEVIPSPVTAVNLRERFGLRTRHGQGVATTVVHNPTAYLNRRGTLHGGVIGLLGELAADEALATTANPWQHTLSLSIEYLGPVGGAGEPVTIMSEVIRAGSQIAVVESRLLASEGSAAAMVTVVRSQAAPAVSGASD